MGKTGKDQLWPGQNLNLHPISRPNKPLSRNTLLKAESNRPKQLIHNIPIGQFLRLLRNWSTVLQDFQSKAVEMKEVSSILPYIIYLLGLSESPTYREGIPVRKKTRATNVLKIDISSVPLLITFNLRDWFILYFYFLRKPPNTVSWLPNTCTGFSYCGHCAQCSNSSDTKYFTH